mmetsp:Transcript_33061/g.76192  ORF Transcript_33061/g.76192 Transcript_33061/m.76192 type:complete len:582 (-) Transcript_33061:179-1924(-)
MDDNAGSKLTGALSEFVTNFAKGYDKKSIQDQVPFLKNEDVEVRDNPIDTDNASVAASARDGPFSLGTSTGASFSLTEDQFSGSRITLDDAEDYNVFQTAESQLFEVKRQTKELVLMLFRLKCDKDILNKELNMTRNIVTRFDQRTQTEEVVKDEFLLFKKKFEVEIEELKKAKEVLKQDIRQQKEIAEHAEDDLKKIQQVVFNLDQSFDSLEDVSSLKQNDSCVVSSIFSRTRDFRKQCSDLRKERDNLKEEVKKSQIEAAEANNTFKELFQKRSICKEDVNSISFDTSHELVQKTTREEKPESTTFEIALVAKEDTKFADMPNLKNEFENEVQHEANQHSEERAGLDISLDQREVKKGGKYVENLVEKHKFLLMQNPNKTVTKDANTKYVEKPVLENEFGNGAYKEADQHPKECAGSDISLDQEEDKKGNKYVENLVERHRFLLKQSQEEMVTKDKDKNLFPDSSTPFLYENMDQGTVECKEKDISQDQFTSLDELRDFFNGDLNKTNNQNNTSMSCPSSLTDISLNTYDFSQNPQKTFNPLEMLEGQLAVQKGTQSDKFPKRKIEIRSLEELRSFILS